MDYADISLEDMVCLSMESGVEVFSSPGPRNRSSRSVAARTALVISARQSFGALRA